MYDRKKIMSDVSYCIQAEMSGISFNTFIDLNEEAGLFGYIVSDGGLDFNTNKSQNAYTICHFSNSIVVMHITKNKEIIQALCPQINHKHSFLGQKRDLIFDLIDCGKMFDVAKLRGNLNILFKMNNMGYYPVGLYFSMRIPKYSS